ncbi:MAG: hypothetical protein OSB70_17280 [Myxococcota bacterium]|nr:hypothetical protein [Myxococcota bacterium]
MNRIQARRAYGSGARSLAALLCILACVLIFPLSSQAQEVPDQWLSDLNIRTTKTGWSLEIQLSAPLIQTSHSPQKIGQLVEISVMPLPGRDRSQDVFIRGEKLTPPKESDSPIREVTLEPQAPGHALLVVKFSRKVSFSLKSLSGGRSLVLGITKPATQSSTAGVLAPSSAAEIESIMNEARRSMTARDYNRAVSLYSKVLSMEGGADLPSPLEYLGLARLKNGQRAHARAEYETYLDRFPDTDGAVRVQQRLNALLSSSQTDRKPLRASKNTDAFTYDAYGTVSTSYQRAQSFVDLSGAEMRDSSQIINFDGVGLMQNQRFDARVRGSGYFRYDFLDSEVGDGSRVRYLNVSLRDRFLEVSGILGRQPGRGGGILGRYDGLSARWAFGDQAYLGAAVGFPVYSATSDNINTDEVFFEARVGMENWNDQFTGEIWSVVQMYEGKIDRAALGYELRWFGSKGSAFSAMDFDAYYQELNLFMASGNFEVREGTAINLLADYRRVPFLTMRSALVGQMTEHLNELGGPIVDDNGVPLSPALITSLDELRLLYNYNDSEVENLAKDRTPTATTLTAGVNQRIGEQWQVSGDFTMAKMTSTPESGGVPAMRGTGWDYYIFTQFIGNNLLTEGDTGRINFRYYNGFSYSGYDVGTSGRFPLFYSLWITPGLNIAYRNYDELSDQIAIRPGLRAQWRGDQFTVESDIRLEWLEGVGGGLPQPRSDEFGYLFDFTVRWDF